MSDTNDAWRTHGDMPDLDMMLGLSEMTQQELRDRLERLQTIVPMRQYGDGLETYEYYLAPQHAETEAMFNAARELSLIRGILGETHPMPTGEQASSLAHAAQTAINTLAELGITYVGGDATYVFWSPKRGRYIQHDAEQRQKLMQRGERDIGYRFLTGRYENSFEHNADLPNHQSPAVTSQQRSEADAWQLAYPWRSSNRLNTLFRLGRLEPNSRIWHAARILSHGARIEDSFAYVAKLSVDEPLRNDDVIEHMREVVEAGLLIGHSAEALVKKPPEYDKIERTEATERRAKAGGRKSASQRALRVEAFMREIENLAPYFPAFSEARLVDQAFETVVGCDRDLWRQGKGQKDAYLSQDIRSVEPYKSRYYAIFTESA